MKKLMACFAALVLSSCGGDVGDLCRQDSECSAGLFCSKKTGAVVGTCQEDQGGCFPVSDAGPPPPCTVDGGQTVPVGASIPSSDGCNTCYCTSSGGFSCTKKNCTPPLDGGEACVAPSNPAVQSYFTSDICISAQIVCGAGEEYFEDACGCGCISVLDAGTPTDGGVACGNTFCGEGLVCCNSSCGICAPPDGACTQEFCSE